MFGGLGHDLKDLKNLKLLERFEKYGWNWRLVQILCKFAQSIGFPFRIELEAPLTRKQVQ